jgi:hypothetical protein
MYFIKTNNHSNILLTIPYRYDLIQSLCVSNEINSFNRKLKNMVSVYQHSSVLEIDNYLFTTNRTTFISS